MKSPKKSTIKMPNFDRCVWFNKKKNRTLSRLDIIYNCILSAKSIKSAMTMLSQLNIGSQDMPGATKPKDEKPIKPKKANADKRKKKK